MALSRKIKHNQIDITCSVDSVDYFLNIDNALARKLKATKRPEALDIVYKGGGIVIIADAAVFELLKEAILFY